MQCSFSAGRGIVLGSSLEMPATDKDSMTKGEGDDATATPALQMAATRGDGDVAHVCQGRSPVISNVALVRPSALPSPRRHCRNGPILLRVFLFHPFLSVVRRDDVAGQGPFGIVTKRWVLGADGMMGKGKGQVRGGRRRGHDSTKAMGGRPTDTRSGGVDRPRAHRRSMTPTSLLATRPFGTATPPLTQLLVAPE